MKITYDPEADAAYIYLATIPAAGVKKTYMCDPAQVGTMINLDFDDEGHLLGVEILSASECLPKAALKQATKI